MAENSKGRSYGHNISLNGPYWDGNISLSFKIMNDSPDQIKTMQQIVDSIKDLDIVPASGQYTYREKKEGEVSVSKDTITPEDVKDQPMAVGLNEAVEANEIKAKTKQEEYQPPIMKVIAGVVVEGEGIKPVFVAEEKTEEVSATPKMTRMSTMSVESSETNDINLSAAPTILSVDTPMLLADTSDDSKLITYGNLRTFAGLTDARYVQLKAGDNKPGSYLTSSEVDEKIATQASNILNSGDTILYKHDLIVTAGENMPGLAYYYIHMSFYDGSSQQFDLSKLYDYLQPGNATTTIERPVIYMADGYCKATNDSIQKIFAIGRNVTLFTLAQLYIYSRRVVLKPNPVKYGWENPYKVPFSSLTCTDTVTPVKAV